MSVLKLSKNDIIRNNDKEEKIKLKRSDLSYDSARVSSWEVANKQSLDILNDYNNRINKSEWLTEEDRTAYRKAFDSYIETSNYLRRINKTFGEGYTDEDEQKWTDSIASMNKGYDEISGYYSQFESDKQYNKWLSDQKKHEEFKLATEAEDFDYYSQMGANIKNPTAKEAEPNIILFGKPIGGEKVGNVVTYSIENKDSLGISEANGGGSHAGGKYLYTFMNEDEVAIYNYYLGKGDTEKAAEYLDTLEDTLNRRQGGQWAENLDGKELLSMVFAIGAGLEQSAAGIRNLDNLILGTDADTTTAGQYASAQVRENLGGGFWGGAYDVINTTSNMLPSILVGTLAGPTAGKIVMGASIAGNSYAEMKNLGYSDWQARGYSAMVTAAEIGLQSVLGGFSQLGGKYSVSAGVTKLVSGLDNAIAKIAINVPLNMASEGLEEAIQTVLEPAFKALVTGEEYEAAEWGDILYSGLLGALSAGLMEGVPSIANGVSSTINANTYKNIYGVDSQALVSEALEIDSENTHAQRMQNKLNSGKELSGYNLQHLVESNENALYEQDISNITDKVVNRLTELGEKGDVSRIASVIAKQVAGESLTHSDKQILKNSTFGQRVANEINPENIESGLYSSAWAENIGTEKINTEAYNRESVTPADAKPNLVSKNTPIEEKAIESEISPPETVSESVTNTPEDISTEEESTITLEEASSKYGAQAQAMVHTYVEGQDVAKYDKAYKVAYDMGQSGVSLSYVMNSETTSYLTEKQKELAYEAGKAASDTLAKEQDAKNKQAATGKTGRKKGTVKGEGVKIEDLKKTFNDTQNRAYKILSTYAELTGIDIVLYKSEANANGDFEGAQGKFDWSDDKLYIDINAGLKNIKSVDDLAKYAMLRTFSHEFTHFIEKWNPIWYNEFRKVVFETLTERGENVHDLIEAKLAQDKSGKMTYEKASREVVAEAMTDILPDSHFAETLANKHKNIFDKLLEKLKEFLANIKAYFNTLGHNRSREANALKEQVGDAVHYVENIVKLFDKVAVEAVENYQMTVAFDEAVDSPAKVETESAKPQTKPAEKTLFEKYDEVKQKYPNNIVLYRVGDFFEVLGEDAKSVSEWADLTLTSRNDPNSGRVPMVGFPYHKLESFLDKIRAKQDVTLVQEENGTVKEYPMVSLESSKNRKPIEPKNNTVGGINNAEQRAETEIEDERRTDSSTSGSNERTLSQDGDGRGVSEGIGRVSSTTSGLRGRRKLSQTEKAFSKDSFITPKNGTVEAIESEKVINEYGIECYVVKKSEWVKEAQATSLDGRVYIKEGIDEKWRGIVAAHEVTHVMKQLQFKPYLDFIKRTPDMLNMNADYAHSMMDRVSKHRNIDIFNMDDSQLTDFYDEINSTLYGHYVAGQIIGDFGEKINSAFYDFNAYINELSSIHEQFKKENATKKAEEGVGEWSDVYERLRNPLSRSPRFYVGEKEGYLFRIYKSGEQWQGHIDKVTQHSDGKGTPYPVRDTGGFSYKSEVYTNRADAIEDIISVAKENKLFEAKVENSEKVSETITKAEAEPIVDEEFEKQYKKISQWLKKASRKYVMWYKGERFISDGGLAIRTTKDIVDRARSEFVGLISETDAPKAVVEVLEKATTPLSEAPLEGGVGTESVYIFNVDGKQAVYNKKLLTKLDGNLFYVGDFNGFKLLKAVDTEGNLAGFLMPLRVNNEITNTKPSKLKSFSNKFISQISKQEVKPNVENVDNRATVQQPVSDRQEDSHVLEGLQAEDVSGNVQRGNSVGDSVERGQQTVRDDVRSDAAGTRRGSGVGDSESGDLRRNDELTPEDSEKLHEEVTEQIVQQSTEKPKGKNFVIGDSLELPNGEKARYKANIEAIRLVKQLESEGRYATEAEQVILSKYVGWGGLANAFDERKSDWSKEFKELKELLTDEEYNLARGSTLNAHYTDISVIKAMYDGLNKLGFNGGRMMEPSSGVGNFVGAMPAEMSAKVKSWTMVELDGITGLIAKYLYPNADVRIQGFEKANIPNNYMDVIISNVPFGNYPITDKAYPKKVTSAIHNYFFAKSLDKVRPGGIVMFITSSYTMNSKDETVRRYIMQRADLLGAIRLPDSAFKGNAGTEVVTDILILKKRAANTAYAGEEFLTAPYKYINGYNGAYINTYFDAHPEMVLGTASMEGSMYRSNNLTYKALEGKGSLADQIREAFTHIKGKMDYPAQLTPEKTNFAVERAGKKTKQDGYVSKNGKIYQNKDGELVERNVTPKVAERIKGMLEIRDAAKALMNAQQQGLKETEIKKARADLNKLYDSFVKKNGYLNTPSNKSVFKDDPDSFFVYALENWNNDEKTATKADIFSKNTIAPNRTVTSAKDVSEGLIVSVNQTGGVDIPLIAALTKKSVPDVTRELIDSRKVFKNRDGILETAETYLSGNVRAKLRDAEALVPMDSDYQKNVEALKAVMPEDVSYQDIFVNPGTPWIPASVYSDFAAYMLGGRNTEWRQDIDVTRNSDTGNFTVELKNSYLKHNASNTQKWGTPRRSFLDLFDAMLNSKSVVIKNKLEDGSSVIDRDATAAANEKIENITKEFQDWLWRDESRRTELATLYNEVFNSIVTPKYNGDNLTVNGANALKPLRPHQRNAVQRIIASGGNTLLAHKVGAGKTYEMAAAAMKLKELGLVKKPMFAVPKSLVAQWGVEFIDFFPTAKLLVADATDFTAANRKVFMNRIANGNYDAVIVSYEQFEKLPVSDDFTRELYQEQINSVIAAIEEAKAEKGGKSLSVKDLEKKRKSLQAKIDKLTDKAKDEGNIDFEELGVDSLFIDEAHNFKNLFYTTSMTNVSGLGNKDGSKRAFDLYTKVRYLQKLNGGKGIVFATATPVMNSMSEMYIMQKYLQPDLLEQLGLNTFDAWAKQFGEVVNGVEIKPSGQGYRVKQSFSRFKNMSELQLLFRNFADVLTDIPGLKIPKMKGGAVNVVVCEPGQFQKDFMKELEKRADNIKNVDPSVDNMLKITSDGRKISYTQRMIDPSLPYEEGSKIYRAADNIVRVYNESKDIKGTQVVFLDMATPKGKSKAETIEDDDVSMDMESARLYDDLKARLIQKGIPAKEIAFIHEADTDQKKKKLFADVNEGKVRVLIGSTGKMGVGMNAQKRIVAIHHLDAPWRPGDVEQRNGRAYRQGNINEEVENFTYVTEGSFDARLWDILERKQNFINQVMNGESVGRETEDTGEVTLSAAEVKALASGSPLIMEQVQLDTDIKKLESLYRAHLSSLRAARERLVSDKGKIEVLERMIDLGKSDMLAIKDTYSEGKFSLTVGKHKFTEKKEAGVALMTEAVSKAVETGYTTIGSFAGFDVRVMKTSEGIQGLISGKQGYSFNTYPNNTTFMINHMISVVEGITEKVNAWRAALEETKKDMAEQEKLINEPFAKQAELDEKRKRYNEVMEILNPKEEQSLDSVADDTVQEQSRDYLEEDDYSTDGVHWGIEEGIMSNADARAVWEAIANIEKRGFRSYPKTVNGDYFVESESALMIVDSDYKHPVVKTIFKFKDNESYAKEVIIRAREIQQEVRKAESIIEMVYGEGYVSRYDFADSTTYGWKNGRGKGSDSRKSSERTAIREWIFEEQEQQRTDTLTDREVLELAANEVKVSDLTQAENDALTIFQNRLSKLKTLQDERAEKGRLYKDQQFGAKVDRAEASKTLERMHVLDEQIKKATAEVLTVEEKEVLKRVLKKARTVVEKQERQHGQEILNRWRERRNNAAAIKKYRDRLRGDVDELTNWIISPDNKDIAKHVPDVLKNSVIPFLSSINFMSKRSLKGGDATVSDKEFVKRLEALKSAIKINIDVYGLYSGYNDLPDDFMDSLQNFINSARSLLEKSEGEFIINQMTSVELKELSQVVRTLKKYIMQINRFHNNAMYQHVYEAGNESVEFLKELGNAGSHTGGISNFVFWQQIRPAYAFERFGEGGKAIYDGLRRGQAKLAFNTKEIVNFTEKAYTEKEVKAWENEIKTFTFGNDIVKIPVSYIMSFYELTKDPEAKVHIDGEGIRVATYTRKGKKISDVGHILTVGEFNQIMASLTPRQREVADNLQKYMAEQGGKWGNYVSVARFGEEKFTNPKYFPINSDGRHLSATVDEHPSAAALYALLNMSFTKSRKEGANNRIVLYSIFDVFANHMASMAQYNAMALPILDALKWFNYQQVFIDDEGNKTVIASVREQMARVYGVPEETKPGSGKQGYAETFIVNIIKAFNGTAAQGTPYDTLGLKSLHTYNIAQVAYNLRVVLQQPLAITRAGMLIDFKSIIKGMKLNPSAIKKNVEEMQKYSGIAAWKSLGFYDVNISRGLTNLIKHDSNFLEKIGDVGMWGAEKADIWTWAAIWSAAKEEVTKKQHLTPESEGFYEAVNKLFEDIIYKTQVVDSVLTKNEFMRDKGTFARLVGSFMSEPVTNASMLIDALDKYNLDVQRGMTKRDAWRKNSSMIGRRLYVYGIGAVLLAAVQAVADGLRDDDEYEEFDEKWVEAFGGNLVDELMPFNKLPIMADFYDLSKAIVSIFGVDTYGTPPQSVFMQWYDSLVKGVDIIYDKIAGENTNYTWYAGIFKLLQATSGMSGLPLASVTRELITAWNNIVGYMAPSLKVISYETTQSELRTHLYKAIIEGDESKVERIRGEYADEKDYNAALRKALRENDPRIREAAEAVLNKEPEKLLTITKEIVAEGNFSWAIVDGAIDAEIEALKREKS